VQCSVLASACGKRRKGMPRRALALAFASCLIAVGLADNDFDYSQHGKDWEIGQCKDGGRQSPVNFDDVKAPPTDRFVFSYQPLTSLHWGNPGKGPEIQFGSESVPGGLLFGGKTYYLTRISFHTPSEHRLRGKQMALEMQLHHSRANGGPEAVVSVLFSDEATSLLQLSDPVDDTFDRLSQFAPDIPQEFMDSQLAKNEGSAEVKLVEGLNVAAQRSGRVASNASLSVSDYAAPTDGNAMLNRALKSEPPEAGGEASVSLDWWHDGPFDLNAFLDGKSFFQYAGSDTTPPCAENVQWLVKQTPYKSSSAQIKVIQDIVEMSNDKEGNFRVPKPLNGRFVAVAQAVKTAHSVVGMGDFDYHPRDAEQFIRENDFHWKGKTMVQDAAVFAKTANDYARDLDSRLRNAAKAHVQYMNASIEDPPGYGDTAGVKFPRPPNSTGFSNEMWFASTVAKSVQDAMKKAVDHTASDLYGPAGDLSNSYFREEMRRRIDSVARNVMGRPQLAEAPAPAPLASSFLAK